MPSPFLLFSGRLINTGQIVTIAPPRPEGGKHMIEARVVGGNAYLEEYEDADEAAGRYLAIASELLDDPTLVRGVRGQGRVHLADVTSLPSRDA